MAINPGSLYSGQTAAPSASYPYGAAQNITVPGDGTGTPWEAALVNDIFGWQQAILNEAGVAPSGTPETALVSQYQRADKFIKGLVVADYAALRAYTSSRLLDGTRVFITGQKTGGAFVIKTGTVTDNGGTKLVFTDDSNRYAERIWLGHISVAWFGAVGDGSTNDTASIVAANAELESVGHGKLLFPYTGNSYRVASGSLEIAANFMDWEGDGGVVELECFSATGDVLLISGSVVNVRRIRITADTGTRITSGRGIVMDAGLSITQGRVNLIDVQVEDQPGNGIEGVRQEHGRYINVWVENCGGKGFYFHDSGGTRGINCAFINCRAYANANYQWHIWNQSNFYFEGCQSLEGTFTWEVFIQSGTQHLINGFDMERATSSGGGMIIGGSGHRIANLFARNFVTYGLQVNVGIGVDVLNPRVISDTATPVTVGIQYANASGHIRYHSASFTNCTTNYSETGTNNVQRDALNVSYGRDVRGLRDIITYAAAVTPDADTGSVKQITLTGNITINAPTNPAIDAKLRFNLIQDVTGGRTVTWNSIFKFHTAWSDTGNVGSSEATIEFVWNGAKWMQTQPQTGWTT